MRFVEAAQCMIFEAKDYFKSGVDWRALCIWTVVIVVFCLLFHVGTHILPSRIAAMILR